MASVHYALSSTSPLFHYSPYIDGISPENGWVPMLTPNTSSLGTGDISLNSSLMITGVPGASIFLSFHGTGISLTIAGNSSFEVSLDGVNQPQLSEDSSQLLDGLDNSTVHNISLTVGRATSDLPGLLLFGGASILPSEAATGLLPIPVAIDNRNTSIISYYGNWSTQSDPEVPSSSAPEPFHLTTAPDASASFQFISKAVELRGAIDVGWGIYSVDVDGVSYTFNASTSLKVPDTTLFYLDGLDDSQHHELTMTNVNVGTSLALTTVTVFSHGKSPTVFDNNVTSLNPQNSTKSDKASHLSKGAIIGIVLGVFALLIILNLVLWFFFYRHFLERKRKVAGDVEDEKPLELEQDPQGSVTPFLLPGEAPPLRQQLVLTIPIMRKDPLPGNNAQQEISVAPQVADLGAAADSQPEERFEGEAANIEGQLDTVAQNVETGTVPDGQDDLHADRRIRVFSERIVDVVVERIRQITRPHERNDIAVDSPSQSGPPPQYEEL